MKNKPHSGNKALFKLGGSGLGLVVYRNGRGLIIGSRIVVLDGQDNVPEYSWLSPEETVKQIVIPDNIVGLAMLAMLAIPRGYVASYSQIAEVLKTTPRHAGLLASKNKLPVIVPCHRVVRSDGYVGGYSAARLSGVKVKESLLALEGVDVDDGKVPRRFFVDTEDMRREFYKLYHLYYRYRISEDGHGLA